MSLLESEHAQALTVRMPRQVVLDAVRAELETACGDGFWPEKPSRRSPTPNMLGGSSERRLHENDLRRLQRVVNATGIVIHTNMGRAPMSDAAVSGGAGGSRELLQSGTGFSDREAWRARRAD